MAVKQPPVPLALVEWNDCKELGHGVTLQDISASHMPEVITTLGWVLKDDEAGISIANEFYDETYRGVTFIMRVNIRKVTPYALSTPRKPRARKIEEETI